MCTQMKKRAFVRTIIFLFDSFKSEIVRCFEFKKYAVKEKFIGLVLPPSILYLHYSKTSFCFGDSLNHLNSWNVLFCLQESCLIGGKQKYFERNYVLKCIYNDEIRKIF